MAKSKPKPSSNLKGWAAIARYIGQTPSVAQRWHKEGMPVSVKGRFVYGDPEELTRWVGTDKGKIKPLHIASSNENLAADLKEALNYVKQRKK